MKKWNMKGMLAAALAGVVLMGGASLAFAADFAPLPLAEQEVPVHDYTKANTLPMTGYFTSEVTVAGAETPREVRWYIPETAQIRPFYHFIAVDDNVDVDAFLVESGWKQIADETGECLFILMPDVATGVWGEPDAEAAYVAAAKALHSGSGKYFTTLGEFYLTGYGAGAKHLERWAAENPHWIIAQTYVDGEPADAAKLAWLGNRSYGLKHMTDGDIKAAYRLDEDGNQKILFQMQSRLADILNPDAGIFAGLLKKQDMAVPTFLINPKDTADLAYWQKVNKAEGEGEAITEIKGLPVEGTLFAETGMTWTTEYAGNISKVVCAKTDAAEDYTFTKALRDEMADYFRYDVTISYGNALCERVDYSTIVVESKKNGGEKAVGEVTCHTLDGEEVKAEVSYEFMTLENEAVTDLLMFIPETAPAENIPVIVVMHGGSQTSTLFMDCTCWWQTAAKEGVALALSTRTAHTGSRFPEDMNVAVFDGTVAKLKEDGRFDLGRVYVTGQSAGAGATTDVAANRPEQTAAVCTTNAGNAADDQKPMPWVMIVGEGNYTNRGIPGFESDTSYPEDDTDLFVRSSEAAAAGADIVWNPRVTDPNSTTPSHNMMSWVDNMAKADGISNETLRETVVYSGASELNGGWDGEGTLADFQTNNARIRTFTWDNADGIPVVYYMFTLFQAHNCQPWYRPDAWDLMKHYSIAEDGTRYYSESGFAEDDAVVIFAE